MRDGREAAVCEIAERIASLHLPHPMRVAVDGPDAAGKTTLADELVPLLRERGRPVVRVSIDGFLRPRPERAGSSALSAIGYYREAFDVNAFVDLVLRPLRVDGDRVITESVFDYRADTRTVGSSSLVDLRAVVLVDGVFLQRHEFRADWDVVVYVDVSEPETLARARRRDAEVFGSVAEVEMRYTERYLPAQELYRGEVDPIARAHVVVDNEDPTQPVLVRCHIP